MTLRVDYGQAAPDTMQALYAANSALDTASIDQSLRRLAELRVSQINGCNYCIWLHSKQARDLGESEERIESVGGWRNASYYTAAERAAFDWTEAVTLIADGTPPDDLFSALGAHFDDRQIVDLTATVANMNALNRMGISFCLEPPE